MDAMLLTSLVHNFSTIQTITLPLVVGSKAMKLITKIS